MNGRNVLVGITGGIAAYKIPPLVRRLRKSGCDVKTVVTGAAKTLVGVDALRTLSGNITYADGAFQYDMDHIRLAEWADVFAICPATANTIAKIANGIADNLLTTLALSIHAKKIIVAPAMNCVMWESEITQANVRKLVDVGICVLPVESGELACGVTGRGRMLDIEIIAQKILAHLPTGGAIGGDIANSNMSDSNIPVSNISDSNIADSNIANSNIANALSGKKILISSGPTEEPIDPVRVITNKSSGKTGAALVKAALGMGAEVTVVSGPATAPLPVGVKVVNVKTAGDMARELYARFDGADICIMAAAVSDYRVVNPSSTKINRADKNITLELAPNPDILARLGETKKPHQYVVGFALENSSSCDDENIGENVEKVINKNVDKNVDKNVIKNIGKNDDKNSCGISRAREKMKRKNCDMMIFNNVDVSLGGDSTAVTILYGNGEQENIALASKDTAAQIIMRNIAKSAAKKITNNKKTSSTGGEK